MSVAVMSPPGDVGEVKIDIDHHDGKQALTPPTSESTGNKGDDDDDSGSELSELEPEEPATDTAPEPEVKKEEEDDIDEEIVPDYYYEGGKVPVFKPTMKQFRSFKQFIDKIDKYGMKSGIVKVIPPKEWRDGLPQLDEQVKTIKVKNPITQEFHGTQGTYTQANIEKQRSYNLPQWKALCEESSNQPPAKRGERRLNQDKPARASSGKSKNIPEPVGEPKKKGPGRPRVRPLRTTVHDPNEDGDTATDENKGTRTPLTPTSPPPKPTKSKKESLKSDNGPQASKPRGRQPKTELNKSVSSRRQHNRRDQADVVDEEAFKGFDYRVHNQEEWSTERVQELERLYWKSLNFSNPMYGADMPGSLFDDTTKDWNVAKLENLMDVLGQNVPGVNTAYLYLGMWKASFAWHLEDVDLYSINYIHFGAPKQWYSISQADARKFEAAMRTVWPNDSKNCDQFLRHKTYLISPEKLQQQHHIKVNRLVHHEGEFVITFPYGYHSGYNLGYNCAESVNFATDAWLDYGRIARKCNCEADSVWVDVREIERKIRGEPTPEYYEETDDEDEDEDDEPTTLPTPPGSVKGKPKRSHKRKRDPTDKDAKPKTKKLRLKIKAPSYEPCFLCPNDFKHEKLLPTDNGKQAHRRCALYTPETWISEEDGQEMIHGIAQIDKARLEMKCNYCRNKKGSVFQCSQKKCVRAYHATCAAQSGILVDIGLVPVFGEDGTEYTDTGIDFRCRIHRGRRGKHVDGDALEEVPLIKKTAQKLPVGEVAQFQYLQGDIFAGVILENRKSEQTFLIETLPKNERFEVEWKWLLVFDPVNSQLPMPSEGAKPLPAELAHKSRTTAEDPAIKEGPKPNELFCDSTAFRWEEFETRKAFRNSAQVKTDFSKPKQLWFYLGKHSTEAKAQYTSDVTVRHNDPSGNFLETVRIASAAAAAAAAPVHRKSMSASYPSMASQNTMNAHRVNHQQYQAKPQANIPGLKERPYNGKYAVPSPVQNNYQYKPKVGYNVDSESLRNQRAFTHASSIQSPYHNHASAQQYPNYRAPQASMASVAPMAPMVSAHSKIPEAYQGTPEYRPEIANGGRSYPSSTHNFQRPAPYQLPQARLEQQQHAQWSQPVQPPARPNPLHTQFSRPQAPVANMMGTAVKAESPAGDITTFSRPSSVPQSTSAMSLPPTPTAPIATVPEIKGVSHLKIPEKYAYLHDAEKARPKVYQSPYAAEGGFTAAYLPAPAALPKTRPRGPSISEGYLMKRTPSQQEAVNRKLSEDKLRLHEEAQAKARLHDQQQNQRRNSFNHSQAYYTNNNSINSSYQQQRPQHIPLSAIQQPQASYPSQPQPYRNPYAASNPYHTYSHYSPPYVTSGLSHKSQPSSQYQQLQQYQQPKSQYPHHSPTYHPSTSPVGPPTTLQFQSPQEFQMQINRESQRQSPNNGGFDQFFKGMQNAAGVHDGPVEGGWKGYSSNGNEHGSPLKHEMGGGGEMLPVMREGSRF